MVEPTEPEPELERTARRMRRWLWAFRLLFYPGAALLLPALLSARSSDEAEVSSTWLRGHTGQEQRFTMRIDDHRPAYLRTIIVATCPDGSELEQRWRMGDGAPTSPFVFEDRTLRVTRDADVLYSDGKTRRVTLRVQARVDDDSVTGSVWLMTRVDDPGGAPYVCESGPVPFSAAAV